MQARLLDRETGDISHHAFARAYTTELLSAFAPAPQHRFNGELSSTATSLTPTSRRGATTESRGTSVIDENRPYNIRAHGAGVTSLALEKFDGRILISGGAEGNIKLWDLEGCVSPHSTHTFKPISTIVRSPVAEGGGQRLAGHSHGITHLAFYPFDPDAFLSSSYDKTLKLWSTARTALSASFNLNSTIYSHSTSPVADHLLVACATQQSHVRLVDLKSGSAVQTLVAHGGPVLSTVWSPRQDHILVSGHADGKIRIWDIRRAGGVVALLDQEDSLGVVHKYKHRVAAGMDTDSMPRFRAAAQAHDEAVNALQWTSDGRYIVSAGLDGRMRVWDAATGANTLASFGSLVQNRHAKTASIILPPPSNSSRDHVFWANDQDILLFDLHNGNLVTRLRSPVTVNPVGPRGDAEIGRNRISSMVWRSSGGGGAAVGPVMGGSNSPGALYSAHLDGHIRAWMPQIPGPDDIDEEEEVGEDNEAKKRKRKVVDDAFRSLMGRQITFT
jgi:DNA excision repair protein ERCC-8